jgi:hypothetical protein
VRRFSNPNEEDMTKAETEAEEERMAASMEVINGVADEILAEPVQTRRDLPPCAEVAFWYQWSGIDPQGPDAIGQMEAGPMRGGKAIAPSGRPLHWRPSRLDGT